MGAFTKVVPAVGATDIASLVSTMLDDCKYAAEIFADRVKGGHSAGKTTEDLNLALANFFETRYGIRGDIASSEAWEVANLNNSERAAAIATVGLFGKVVKVSYEILDPVTPAYRVLNILTTLQPEELHTNPNKDSLGYAQFEQLSTRDKISLLISKDRQTGRVEFLGILSGMVSAGVDSVDLKTAGNAVYQPVAHQRFIDLALSYLNSLPMGSTSIAAPLAEVKAKIDDIGSGVIARFERPLTPGLLEAFARSKNGLEQLVSYFGSDSLAAVNFQ